MKKILYSLAIMISFLLLITACSSESATTGEMEASNLDGVWTYQEPNDQDPTLIVTFEFDSKDNTFETQVTQNALEDNLEDTTAVVTGSYEESDDKLDLTIDSVEGDGNVVKEDDTVSIGYTMSGDSEALTITDGQLINSNIPESIELAKNNDSN